MPAANAPSDSNIGSNGDHSSLGNQGFKPLAASLCTVYQAENRKLIQAT